MKRGYLATAIAVLLLATSARWSAAGYALADLSEGEPLELIDADVPVSPGRMADLLLVAALRERLAAGALSLSRRVPVVAVAGDPGPPLDGRETLEVGELLQLLLLTDSRGAARSLATAVGPGSSQAVMLMRKVAARLGLGATHLNEDDLFPPDTRRVARSETTSLRDLLHLAIAVAKDEEIRRRLSLDGVPIADGRLIVRATAPLIWTATDPVSPPLPLPRAPGPAILVEERDGLTLLAVIEVPDPSPSRTSSRIGVAAPTSPRSDARRVLDDGFSRYQRVVILHAGQPVGPDVEVRGGIIARFKAVAAEQVAITKRRDSGTPLGFRLQLPETVRAPVAVDEPLGELIVERDDRLFAVVPLVAPMSIAPSRWLDTAHP